MKIVKTAEGWKIEGEGKERARLAYLRLEQGKLIYDL